MLRSTQERYYSSLDDDEVLEHTDRGEPMPPSLVTEVEAAQPTQPDYARTQRPSHEQVQWVGCLNNNNKGDYSLGFDGNKSDHFNNSELITRNHSSGNHNTNPSRTSLAVSSLMMDKCYSQPGSPAVQRRFERELQSRMSDAVIVKERRKKMNSMRNFSQDNTLNSNQGHVTRKRHSSGGALLRKPALDRRELAFGPMWIDGNGSPARAALPKTGYQDNVETQVSSAGNTSQFDVNQNPTPSRKTVACLHQGDKELKTERELDDQSSSRQRTIAPIGSLDDQIQERRNQLRVRSHTLPEKAIRNQIESSPVLTRAATLPESSSEESESRPETPEIPVSPVSPLSKLIQEEITGAKRTSSSVPDISRAASPEILINCSQSASVSEMKTALKRIRSRRHIAQNNSGTGPLKPTRQLSMPQECNLRLEDARDRSASSFSLQPPVEMRKRSGSFGSRMLRRARSAVTRQSKVIDLNDSEDTQSVESPKSNRRLFKKQKSLNEKQVNRLSLPNGRGVINQSSIDGSFYEQDSLHGISEAEVARLSHVSSTSNILMQGDLLRRKRITWAKTWAVLTNDHILALYKSKRDFEASRRETLTMSSKYETFSGGTSLSGILSIVNLSGGYEIEIVEQGKKGCIFQIIPHSFHNFMPPGMTSTLPIDTDWRRAQKSVQLMCKNYDEAVYWVKALVELNNREATPGRKQQRRNLALDSDSPDSLHRQSNFSDFEGISTKSRNRDSSPSTAREEMERPIRRVEEPGQRDIPVVVALLRSTRHGSDRASGIGFPATKKNETTKNLNLDDIKYIDDDEDSEVPHIRVMSTEMDKHGSPASSRDICGDTEEGKVHKPDEMNQKPLSSVKLENNRRELVKLRKKLSGNTERRREDLKRCSVNEKIDMRKAHIIAGGSSHRDLDSTTHSDESRQEGDRKFSSNHKHTEYFLSHRRQGHKDMNEDSHSMTDNTALSRREESGHAAKANSERDKSDREKSGERKKHVIATSTDCKEQTIVSLRADKADGTSPDNGVYRGEVSPNENISSGKGSAKDKHCSSPTEKRKNSKDFESCKTDEIILAQKDLESGKTETTVAAIAKTDSFTDKSRLSRSQQSSIRYHSTRGGHVRKQKSLRQKVLRKLGPQVAPSNSTPDLTAAVEDEILDLQLTEERSAVKLRRHSAFRSEQRSPIPLTRCLSEGNLFLHEGEEGEEEVDGGNMRNFKNVRKLSQDTFIETYGVMPRKKNDKNLDTRKKHTGYDINKNDLLYDEENGFLKDLRSQRRSSASESSSGESSSYQASVTYSEPVSPVGEIQKPALSKSKSDDTRVMRRQRSSGSDDSGNKLTANKESRNSWIASLTPHFGRKANKDSSASKESSKSSKKAVFQIPATSLTSASHRGYLDRRNKKKQWERFWCVLQDSCLYCYHSPKSECTQDAVVLRGYDVIADVTNLNRTRFPFRLERNGSPTLHFSSDNPRDFMLWAGTLEKETTNVLPGSTTDNEVLVNSVKSSTNAPRNDTTPVEGEFKSKSADGVTKYEPYEMQKEILLREVLAHQHKFIEEQKLLQEKNANAQLPVPTDYSTSRSLKDQVNDKYTKAREDEEMKMMKCLTHLNKRRNSAQLKVDQVTKQLAPKSGRKRRENPHQYADMEAKLKLLQERLVSVDKEIEAKRTTKQDVIEKIQQRRDLELMILEQREALEIIQKHNARQKRMAFAQQTQPQDGSERLASIDEISTISDCSSASSNSLPDPMSLSSDPRILAMSTPRQNRAEKNNNNKSESVLSEPDSGFHRSSDTDEVLSQGGSSVEGVLNDDLRTMSTSSDDLERARISRKSNTSTTSTSSTDESTPKKDEIDPSILADIEDFQRFSRQKLASLESNP